MREGDEVVRICLPARASSSGLLVFRFPPPGHSFIL